MFWDYAYFLRVFVDVDCREDGKFRVVGLIEEAFGWDVSCIYPASDRGASAWLLRRLYRWGLELFLVVGTRIVRSYFLCWRHNFHRRCRWCSFFLLFELVNLHREPGNKICQRYQMNSFERLDYLVGHCHQKVLFWGLNWYVKQLIILPASQLF